MNIPGSKLWFRLRLAEQYALVSMVVLVGGMLVIGAWVSEKVQTGVIENSGINAALYLNSFVSPVIQQLITEDDLSVDTIHRLDELYRSTELRNQIESFKIWALDGRVLYSSNPSMIGKIFPIESDKAIAWRGGLVSKLSDLDEAEHVEERKLGIPLVEIYSPIHAQGSPRIIAVAEFYQNALDLSRQLDQARIEGWLVVAGTTLMMFAILFVIVIRGSKTITTQQNELQRRVIQLSELLNQNRQLRAREREFSHRAVELNERFLTRLGSDLHDGPAQILGYALLRLDALKRRWRESTTSSKSSAINHIVDQLREALAEALQEIRVLSRGLALPELTNLEIDEVIEYVVLSHGRKTNRDVQLSISELPKNIPAPIKICVYRVVQEALNNSHAHSNAEKHWVRAHSTDSEIYIEVCDDGVGFDSNNITPGAKAHRLGLLGMRRRVEGLGGQLEIDTNPGVGTSIVATIPTAAEPFGATG